MTSLPKVVITADDFGWTSGQNQAVERAHRAGTLSAASILANGAAFDEAVAIHKRQPTLRVGVHLTLSEGRPLADPRHLPNLSRGGAFYEGLLPLLGLWQLKRLPTSEALVEWRAQVEKVLAAGITPTHLDSHKHVHLFPPLLRAAIAVAKEYQIPILRLPRETAPPRSLRRRPGWLVLTHLCNQAAPLIKDAGLVHTTHFVGFGESGAMTRQRLRLHVQEALAKNDPETTEIMVHPAADTQGMEPLKQRYRWARQYQFQGELQALEDPEVAGLLRTISL